MNADELRTSPGPDMATPCGKGKALIMFILGLFLAGLALLNWQTNFCLSPRYTLRITDDSRLPIPGLVVVHEWGLSVMQHGEDKAATDTNGIVRFSPTTVRMSMLRRLSIRVLPSARGMGYENYNSSRFRVYIPRGLATDLTDGEWSQAGKVSTMYTNSRGMFLRINDRSQRLLARAAQVPQFRSPTPPPLNSPQADHLDLFFPAGVNDFELHLHRERPL